VQRRAFDPATSDKQSGVTEAALLFDQFDPISKAILNVTSHHAGNRSVWCRFHSGPPQLRSQFFVIPAAQCRMRLLRGTKIFFYSQMDLHIATRKPATSAFASSVGLAISVMPKIPP